jgi:DNA-binding response OmpR family regulator
MAILVIQRESPTRDSVVDALLQQGYEARFVPDVFSAVSEVTVQSADGIVLDLAGLAESDVEVVRHLRRHCPEAPVILVFPPSKRDLAARGLALGADAYLPEPFYMEELLALLRRTTEPVASRPVPDLEFALVTRLFQEAAHELNNPLQIIQGLLDLDESVSREDLVSPVSRIREVARLLVELGQLATPEPTPVPVGALLEEVALRQAEPPDLEVETDRLVLGHRSVLSTVLDGLLRRARGDTEGLVFATCRDVETDGETAVAIRIEGPAPAESDLPARRADRSQWTLFLAFCDLVARTHRGRLEIEERSDGGAVYRLVLPSLAGGGESV